LSTASTLPKPQGTSLPLLPFTAALALTVGIALSVGADSKTAVVIPLAVGSVLLLGTLAMTRFVTYVIVMLTLRASLDVTKLGATGPSAEGEGLALFDPSTLLAVLFVLMGILWLASQYRHAGALPGSSLRTALLLFLFTCCLSILGSRNPTSGIAETMRIVSAVMMFVVVEHIARDPGKMRRILAAIYLSALFPLAFTTFGFLMGNPRSEVKGSFTRILGTFNQSNGFGRYLMLLIIMGVAIYPYLERRWQRCLGVLLVGCSLCLVLTYTRSALIGTVLGLVIVGLIQNRRIVAGVLVAGALALVIVPNLSGRFTELASDNAAYPERETTLDWRLDYWADVLPLANSNPVTGIGLGQTQYYTAQGKAPHNDFLRAYVETGLIGLGAYVILMITLISTGFRALAAAPTGTMRRGIALGFLGCAIAFAADSTVANVISNMAVLWYFLAFAAMATAITQDEHARRAPDPARSLGIQA